MTKKCARLIYMYILSTYNTELDTKKTGNVFLVLINKKSTLLESNWHICQTIMCFLLNKTTIILSAMKKKPIILVFFSINEFFKTNFFLVIFSGEQLVKLIKLLYFIITDLEKINKNVISKLPSLSIQFIVMSFITRKVYCLLSLKIIIDVKKTDHRNIHDQAQRHLRKGTFFCVTCFFLLYKIEMAL